MWESYRHQNYQPAEQLSPEMSGRHPTQCVHVQGLCPVPKTRMALEGDPDLWELRQLAEQDLGQVQGVQTHA